MQTTSAFNIFANSNPKRLSWSAVIVSVLLLVGSVVILPSAKQHTEPIIPFVPSILSLMILSELVTSYLLFSQFYITRRRPLLVLAATYLFSGLIIIPHMLAFPGVFTENIWLGTGSQTATWLWAFWHTGFPLGFILFVATSQFLDDEGDTLSREKAVSSMVLVVTATTLLVFGLTVLAIHSNGFLPTLIDDSNYHQLWSSGVGVITLCINVFNVIVMATYHKNRSGIRSWLNVAALSSFLDTSLTLFGGSRFTIGWYVARLDSLFAGVVVLLALLGEITIVYYSLIAKQSHIENMAYLDPLTGLGNRRMYSERIEKMVSKKEHRRFAAVCLMDLDGFKEINDSLGHDAGDKLLVELSQRLKRTVRESDLVARLGGDEFIILLTSTSDMRDVQRIVERIIEAIHSPVQIDEDCVSVSASVGVALYPLHGENNHEITKHADDAMYLAKKSGKNQYRFYDVNVITEPVVALT